MGGGKDAVSGRIVRLTWKLLKTAEVEPAVPVNLVLTLLDMLRSIWKCFGAGSRPLRPGIGGSLCLAGTFVLAD